MKLRRSQVKCYWEPGERCVFKRYLKTFKEVEFLMLAGREMRV